MIFDGGLVRPDGAEPVFNEACLGALPATDGCAFTAINGLGGSRFVRHAAEGEGHDGEFGFLRMQEALAVHGLVHEAGFKKDDAHAILVGLESGLDQVDFDGVGGGRVVESEGGERSLGGHLAIFSTFPVSCMPGVQAVAAAVAGGFDFSGLSDRAAGFGAVETGGCALFVSSHGRLHYACGDAGLSTEGAGDG
jgi:hypothetical protein